MNAQWTDDELLAAIIRALQAKDMPAVVSLLHVLAVQAPNLTQAILDAIGLTKAAIS